jgi:ubiquinone/menaquinone biosynthesis C-methylase UbiE
MLAQAPVRWQVSNRNRYTVSMVEGDATKRFSSRVNDYVRYRPGYPLEVISFLQTECGLKREHVVADVASGTGIFTGMLLKNGNRVFAVEPNPEMRAAGEKFLASFSNLTSVAGTAEATTLSSHCVDLVTAAQAAHWFDRQKARSEFVRILKPGGWTVLVWNERKTDGTAFLQDYEQLLLTYGTDYREVRHERTTAEIAEFFAPATFKERVFAMTQELDHSSLKGRLLSSSYTPQAGHPNYAPMLAELRRILEAHQLNGHVSLVYDTRVFYGRLG